MRLSSLAILVAGSEGERRTRFVGGFPAMDPDKTQMGRWLQEQENLP